MSETRAVRSFTPTATFLIAHTDMAGHGVAQYQMGATRDIRTTTDARQEFARLYPNRDILAVGIKGRS